MIKFIKERKYTVQFLVLFLVLMIVEAVGDIIERSYIEQAITISFDVIFDFILVALTYMNDTMKEQNNDV